ncbi:hypothetical protein ACH347_04960 [Saccharopolyspora sp. 5N102]|uniref:hypothetical protein n=1 Tax=Saccharopolyspora sp. 5N102 TaxID=3375155 RepID=UPI0037A0D2BF
MTRAPAVTASQDPDAPLNDLEPLRDVIGDARVVGIGESTHHAAEFYRMRQARTSWTVRGGLVSESAMRWMQPYTVGRSR